MLKYLYYLVSLGKSYSVINTHKSMLLQTLPFFGNSWYDKSSLIPRFMKGIFFSRKPRPKYFVTWDVTIVLKFLKTLVPLSSLTLKMLSFNVVALIALATAPRAQTLTAMCLDNMIIEKDCVIFGFTEFLQVSRQGHSFS